MDAPGGPAPKRQRKEPVWKAGFVDPFDKVNLRSVHGGRLVQEGDDEPAGHTGGGGDSPGASAEGDQCDSGPQLLNQRLLDNNTLEITVLHKGLRYRGVLERTGLPPGVGVAAPVTKDELSSIAAAPPHGENPNNQCALCNTPLEHSPVMGISDDKAGVYVKVRVTSNWTARVHLQCAVWCPECVEDPSIPGFYHHMGPAVRRGRALRCHCCKERGATVGCFQDGCPAVYHLTCAVNVGCAFDESSLEVWCPAHLR
ncbi:hypothetical protein HYH03_002288 [Edaphochlamys debaryana]|uniref:PHD-type domain-containing protein n=1 Tax=Edaphochlamys debaryana TaxID=47281 RepID=A0A836C4C3_9CHLO|nr:hypothetical protein HYH03_002288 [Edaphochlamys debaryana]|eukprot:KAG2500006.1 hypothetical protein HYH03_002288 [Edaphochlamys debaryana]